jgi:hypothetical protein
MLTIDNPIAKVVEVLLDRKVAQPENIHGCTQEELGMVTKDVMTSLPRIYQMFLLGMGRGAGRFYEGSHIFYPSMLGLKAVANEMLEEEEKELTLPADAIVFVMHQGYQFLFIRSSEGDDPPVYYYMEGAGEFVKKARCFSEFLLAVARDNW